MMMKLRKSISFVLAVAATVVACGDSAGDGPAESSPTKGGAPEAAPASNPGAFGEADRDASTDTSTEACEKMDIVFVVDNSGSMGEEQDNLAENFPKLGAIIDSFKTNAGAPLDYRLAVTTTDGTKSSGTFLKTAHTSGRTPKCDGGPDRPWLERGDGQPVDFFACRARVGTSGSGTEVPLASLHASLADRIADGTNTSQGKPFLRDDALLAFIIVTDEDERSKTPTVADYLSKFDAIKGGERGRWAAAVIAGETDCRSPKLGSAREATMLKEFVGGVGANGVFASICEGDLTPGVTKALNLFGQACKAFPKTPK